jgi:hypothetical protein
VTALDDELLCAHGIGAMDGRMPSRPESGEPGNIPGVRESVKRRRRRRCERAHCTLRAVSRSLAHAPRLTRARNAGYDGRALSCVGPALAHECGDS